MIGVKANQDIYFGQFAQLEKRLGAEGQPWLRQIRKAALDRFAELGFPTTQQEAWRFTNVTALAKARFETARHELTPSIEDAFRRSPLANLECSRLVFVNGRFCQKLSTLEALTEGVKATSLAEALARDGGPVDQHLARYANHKDHPFVALNTAFIEDGAFVQVPKGLVLEKPIFLFFLTTPSVRPTVSHPRNLLLIGRESQVTLVEAYLSLQAGVYFTNPVTEIVVGENAIVSYCKVQDESERAFHMATLQLEQARNSNVSTHSISLGGAIVRQEVNSVLNGEGAECYLNGLYAVTRQQHVDNYTTLDHAKPHSNSRELYKGILDGKASGVFHGRIFVRKDAQKTDAKQSNKNLLLSDDATINTKPQLEIYADDVKCTHGATIGQIDQEAIFYLRSRGIGRDEARSMLTVAFANEIINRIQYEPLRARLTEVLDARLADGRGPKEA